MMRDDMMQADKIPVEIAASETRFDRRDLVTAIAFFLAVLMLHTPFRTRYAFLWDSVEFIEGMRAYSVVLGQPHPPGYFLYVMAGRLVNVFVGNPNASLVGISLVAGSGLSGVMYLLGTAMFGRRVGVMAALVMLTSPLVNFYSCVALTYVLDAVLICALVLWCWRALQRSVNWGDAVGLGAMLAVIAGVRQQSLFGLSVPVFYTLWQSKSRRGWKVIAGLLACGVVLAIWLPAMFRMTGGWSAYSGALRQTARFHGHKTLAGGGWNALSWNLFFSGLYCLNGMMLGVIGLPFAFRRGGGGPAFRLLALWILPVFLLAVAVGYSEAPGHVFTYLPCLLLLCGVGLARLRTGTAVAVAVCAFNLFVFFAWPRAWDGALWGTIPTARALGEHDELMARTIRIVRERYNPQDTIICHNHGDLFFGLRHFQLYLPEFANYRMDHDGAMLGDPSKPMQRVWKGQLEFVAAIDMANVRNVLLFLPPGQKVDQFIKYWDVKQAIPVSGSGGMLYTLSIDANGQPISAARTQDLRPRE
jgi:hypothetical protein